MTASPTKLRLQCELGDRKQELAQQRELVKKLTAEHEQFQATARSTAMSLQSAQQELQASTAQADQLQEDLTGKDRGLRQAQHDLQHQHDVHSNLELQISAQEAELRAVSEQATSLEADKQQLQQQLDEAAADQLQLQHRMATAVAEADNRASAVKHQVDNLQVSQDCLGVHAVVYWDPVHPGLLAVSHTNALIADCLGELLCLLCSPASFSCFSCVLLLDMAPNSDQGKCVNNCAQLHSAKHFAHLQAVLAEKQTVLASVQEQLQQHKELYDSSQAKAASDREIAAAAAAAATVTIEDSEQLAQRLQATVKELQSTCNGQGRQLQDAQTELCTAKASAESQQVSSASSPVMCSGIQCQQLLASECALLLAFDVFCTE